METMQGLIDELTGKLNKAIADRQKLKVDRDEVRRRWSEAQKEIKEKNAQLKLAQSQTSSASHAGSWIDEEDILKQVLEDLKKKAETEGVPESSQEAAQQHSDTDGKNVTTNDKQDNDTDDDLHHQKSIFNQQRTTRDAIRYMVDLIEIRKKFEPPSQLGVGLIKEITQDDLNE